MAPTISAEVILKSRSGRSLTNPDAAVTADNVGEFTPAPETIARATEQLQALGFTVAQAGVTLTLLGTPEQFAKAFGAGLRVERDERTGQVSVHQDREPIIPDALDGIVETIVFPEPPEFFP